MGLLIFFFLMTVIVSFTCSLLESVLLSISPAYIALKRKSGKKSAVVLEGYKTSIDRPLTAILTVNTFANMIGATGVGAQTLKVFGDIYMAAASVGLTLMVLIFGEIIPKTLGATYWKKLAGFAAGSIRILIFLTYPIVTFSEFFYNLWGVKRSVAVTREEMIVTAEMGATEGAIKEKESTVIANLLKLDQVPIKDIMTPRSVVNAFSYKDTVDDLTGANKTIRFSRIPVFKENFDNVVGLLHRFKLMEAVQQDLDTLTLEKLMTPIHSVPESISVSAALDQFIKRKEHLFLVVDEYGVPTGIVTLEDAIETLLGVEIVDESDSVVDMREHAKEQWKNKKRSFQP